MQQCTRLRTIRDNSAKVVISAGGYPTAEAALSVDTLEWLGPLGYQLCIEWKWCWSFLSSSFLFIEISKYVNRRDIIRNNNNRRDIAGVVFHNSSQNQLVWIRIKCRQERWEIQQLGYSLLKLEVWCCGRLQNAWRDYINAFAYFVGYCS